MLGLLLFINDLAVLIICAQMHDCHVLILSPSVIRIIEREKKRIENLTGQ